MKNRAAPLEWLPVLIIVVTGGIFLLDMLKPAGALLLIDHFDSFYLRLIFRILQFRCPLYPTAARHFGEQLRDEREIVAWWLDSWRALFPLIEQNDLKVERFRRGLFFFYLRCTPIS